MKLKIKYAVVSADQSHYMDFKNLIINSWNNIIGIKPIMIIISDKDDYVIDNEDCIEVNFKSVAGVGSGFQAMVSRMFVSKLFPNDVLITSDIDMMPLSRKYFTSFEICDDEILIASSDGYPAGPPVRFPICYNIFKGSLMAKLLDLDYFTFVDYCKKLASGWGGHADELYFSEKIKDYIKLIKLKRGWDQYNIAFNRIDRTKWIYSDADVISGNYIDSHLLRPYKDHEQEINKLYNLGLNIL